jgi:hypothetical protein
MGTFESLYFSYRFCYYLILYLAGSHGQDHSLSCCVSRCSHMFMTYSHSPLSVTGIFSLVCVCVLFVLPAAECQQVSGFEQFGGYRCHYQHPTFGRIPGSLNPSNLIRPKFVKWLTEGPVLTGIRMWRWSQHWLHHFKYAALNSKWVWHKCYL